MGRKVSVAAVEDGREMVLEGLDGSFCVVVSVIVGGGELIFQFLVFDCFDEIL